MNKHYENPEVTVVQYRKRVKTESEEFTSSAGVQYIRVSCPICKQRLFEVPASEFETDNQAAVNKYLPILENHMNSAHGTK